jgi:hypothetical protein
MVRSKAKGIGFFSFSAASLSCLFVHVIHCGKKEPPVDFLEPVHHRFATIDTKLAVIFPIPLWLCFREALARFVVENPGVSPFEFEFALHASDPIWHQKRELCHLRNRIAVILRHS